MYIYTLYDGMKFYHMWLHGFGKICHLCTKMNIEKCIAISIIQSVIILSRLAICYGFIDTHSTILMHSFSWIFCHFRWFLSTPLGSYIAMKFWVTAKLTNLKVKWPRLRPHGTQNVAKSMAHYQWVGWWFSARWLPVQTNWCNSMDTEALLDIWQASEASLRKADWSTFGGSVVVIS